MYFGEWVPKATSPVYGSSTNMVGQNDSLRTVFFVGENPTTSMPTLVNAKYDVVGLRQYNPGTQAGVYTGVLTANYGGGKASLTGNVGYVSFANTAISADGTFQNNNGSIQGRFYGANASALAGYYKDANSAADHMAFGGAKR
ncbi:Slam-dependent surface lipoprotein [Kerstersia gyiorum]